jgi:threonine synthase
VLEEKARKKRMTSQIAALRCSVCGKAYKPGELEYVCPVHAEDSTPGNLTVEYDWAAVRARIEADEAGRTTWPELFGMWRYRALLPLVLDDPAVVAGLAVGNTPLVPAPELAAQLGLAEVFVKDEGRNPSASLKDRASALVALKAKLEGRPVVSTASTGNAAAALACVCACLKQPCVIFVPSSSPEAKRTQLLVYGARVVLVEGTYDDAFDLCLRACKRFGWYCRSTGYNPYTSEGKKTVSYELCEQLYRRRHWRSGDMGLATDMRFEAPDYVAVSVGDGNIVSGVHKGLADLLAIGRISKMPAIIGVQAEGSASIARAWEEHKDLRTTPLAPIDATTVADSISAGFPRDPLRAVEAASLSGGAYVRVSDDEILRAIPEFARKTGVFAEPAGATTLAGVIKAKAMGLIKPGSSLVIINTGNGLKDIISAKKSVSDATVQRVQKGDLAALEAAFSK